MKTNKQNGLGELVNASNRQQNQKRFLSIILSIFFLIVLIPEVQSQNLGDLLITPTRIILEGNKRNENITLINVGSDSATYSISFLQYRMTDEGGFQEITEPDQGQLFADKALRYFPKQVTLAPKESQTVRLQFMKPKEFADGEYRSHLYFRAVPKPKPIESIAEDTTTKKLNIQLTAIYGVSIPVIIRAGKLSSTIRLDSLRIQYDSLTNNSPVLRLRMYRNGNQSSYGDFSVSMIVDNNSEVIGEAKGVAVYTPLPSRSLQIPLILPGEKKLERCKLLVEYKNRSDLQESAPVKALLKIQ